MPMALVGERILLRQTHFRRVVTFAAVLVVATVSVACSSGTATPAPNEDRSPAPQGEISIPQFDTGAFTLINPEPEIRTLDYSVDLGFQYVDPERDQIARDAIAPIYSPAFTSPGEATLHPEEMVMGLVIDGDSRAYPLGMLRIREMINDTVGGTPVLVTW